MQFLPHTYILTSSSDYSWLSPKKNSVQVGAGEKEWQERESLIFAEEAIALVQQMKLHQWSLPSVGYELSAGKKVIGEAEFAWEAQQVALVLDEVNLHAFQEAGWQVAIIAEILDNPEVFRQENNL
jgi:DEAD/DEAH box helicase domain-containing protein